MACQSSEAGSGRACIFARVRCESCKDELLVAFSFKGRGMLVGMFVLLGLLGGLGLWFDA